MISIEELKQLKSPNIIDIRNSINYNNNHIPGSINIPYEQLITNPGKYLDRNHKYYVYCQRGITSKKLCQILYNQGYNAINIIGGYEQWILEN